MKKSLLLKTLNICLFLLYTHFLSSQVDFKFILLTSDDNNKVLTDGDLMNFSLIMRNEGTVDYDGTPFESKIYLSKDDVLDASDFLMDSIIIDSFLPVGGGYRLMYQARSGAHISTGEYFPLVVIDSDDVFAETDETNNFGKMSGTPYEVYQTAFGNPYYEWIEVSIDENDPERVNLHARITNTNDSIIPPQVVNFEMNHSGDFSYGITNYWDLHRERVSELKLGQYKDIWTSVALTGADSGSVFFNLFLNDNPIENPKKKGVTFGGTSIVPVPRRQLTTGEGRKIRQRPDGGLDVLIYDEPNWKAMVFNRKCQIRYEKILGEGYANFDTQTGFLLATQTVNGKEVTIKVFDEKANIIGSEWMIPVADTVKNHPHIVRASDKSVYVASNYSTANFNEPLPRCNSFIWVTHLDSVGNLLNEKIVADDNHPGVVDGFVVTEENEPYLSFHLYNPLSHYRGSRLFRFDESLNDVELISDETYPSFRNNQLNFLKSDPNGGIVKGDYKAYIPSPHTGRVTHRVSLTRDSTFQHEYGALWLDFETTMHMTNVAPTSDGGMIAIGGWRDTLYYNEIKLIKVDKFGKVDWLRTTPAGGRDIVQLDDGNYAIIGSRIGNAYLAILDSLGRYHPTLNCDEYTLIADNDMDGFNEEDDCNDANAAIFPGAPEIANNGIDEDCDGMDLIMTSVKSENIDSQIRLIPNPSTGQFSIVSPSLKIANFQILDMNGKRLQSGQLITPFGERISIQDFPKGIYLIQLFSEEGQMIDQRRLVKI